MSEQELTRLARSTSSKLMVSRSTSSKMVESASHSYFLSPNTTCGLGNSSAWNLDRSQQESRVETLPLLSPAAARSPLTVDTREAVELELVFDAEGLAVWNDDEGELAAVRDAEGVFYEVLEPLGRGATAEVFLVADPEGRKRAMKVLSRGRFSQAEASALERLEHPNVVRFYGAATSPKYRRAFLFFEYIDGGQLCDMTPEGRLIGERWEEEEVRQVLMDLVSAVAHLHQNGVVHRDIKPQNCLRRKTGEVVLCDFGASERPS